MKGRTLSLAAGVVILALGSLACVVNLGGPAYPADHIPVSTAAATEAQNAVGTADSQATDTGKVTLTLTEAQVTSYLAEQLQQQNQLPITNPQVYLRDGAIQIYGTINQGIVTATAKIVVTVDVDPQGQPVITLTSATFGPFPVPPGLRDTITNQIRQAYSNALGTEAANFQLEKVTIENGTMSLEGSLK